MRVTFIPVLFLSKTGASVIVRLAPSSLTTASASWANRGILPDYVFGYPCAVERKSPQLLIRWGAGKQPQGEISSHPQAPRGENGNKKDCRLRQQSR